MNDIICPHCQKAFKIDEAGYADILKQVHNSEFEQQLNERLSMAQKEKQAALDLAQAQAATQIQAASVAKDREIQDLKAKLQADETQGRLAINEAVSRVEKERDQFKNGLERSQLEKELAEKSLKEKFETQIKDREDMIERLRDMKAKLSTKMVGETLEQHCEIEFNRIVPPPSRTLTSKKTMTPAAAARETTSFVTRTPRAPKSSRSCSK
jgi:hypothetical protein